MLAIEKGQVNAPNNLALLYYTQNTKPKEALQYIRQRHKTDEEDIHSAANQIIVEIWNGIFDNLPERIATIIETGTETVVSELITDLLHQKQIQLVLSFFESEQHGAALRDRYILLYYAALLLAGRTEDNLLLRIPPEVLPTVEELMEKIREKQAFYAKKPQAEFPFSVGDNARAAAPPRTAEAT